MFLQKLIQNKNQKKTQNSSMCIISQKLKATDIREKRTAMRKKLQSQLSSPILHRFMLKPAQISFHQDWPEAITSDSEGFSPQNQINLENKYNFKERNQFQQKYEILEKIGEGANSTIYKCRERISNEFYAVKIMRFRDEELIQNFKKQFGINKNLINDSIIKYYEFILDSERSTTYTILEYCNFKNLKEDLYSRSDKKFSESEVSKILHALLKSLNYLHTSGISHRDIKTDNILYDSLNNQIKVIDLDCSFNKKETENHFQMWTKTGTLNYQAPQVFLNTIYSEKVDIWAVGILVYELLTGRLPFENSNSKKTVNLIVSSDIDLQSLKISENLKVILKGLLKKLPQERLSAKEALNFLQKELNSTKDTI